jgi:riboflavin synthase
MFTGLIEEIGTITNVSVNAQTQQTILTIHAAIVLEDVQLGDSIAVNGVCLTVTSFTKNSFTVGLSIETLQRTTFASLTIGTKVNLERSVKSSTRMGGHYVQGHVDGTGKIIKKFVDGDCLRFEFEVHPSLMDFIVEKGFIAVDGTSLTVTKVTENSFGIMLIQYTQSKIVLTNKQIGENVNVEVDFMGKQIVAYLNKYEAKITKQLKSRL